MTDYDFHQLSPHDFEVMCRDLLQADWHITLASFKTGKDSGIDFRYSLCGNVIVQCKHYARTGLRGLIRDLKAEAVKVRALNPTKYVLLTSVPLSPDNKNAIAEIIGLNVVHTSDVVGCDDLNNRLSLHPEIETRHYKLWLSSRAVFDRVLHNAELTQSEFKVRNVYRDIPRYVQSDAFPRALKMLEEDRLVIVTGPPGVGKTTLANLLLYSHLERGFQAVVIQRDVNEGLRLFQEGTDQIFYYDDFMGATFLGERSSCLGSNDDRLLVEFVAMVRASPRARLVLTTREHIFNQALERSERMRHSGISEHRVILRMSDYTFGQKARILYNHLYFSDLPTEYQDELLRDNFYLNIIRHLKYNPRLIEWLSTYRRVKEVPATGYRDFVTSLLEDPAEIWRHAYERQISEAGRSLLLALFSLGGLSQLANLDKAFVRQHEVRAGRYGFQRQPNDFRTALRELNDAFIKPVSAHTITVLDPSVLDLMNAVLRDSPDNAFDLLSGAVTFSQIERVWSVANAGQGQPIMSAMKDRSDLVAAAVRPRLYDARKVILPDGSTGYVGPTFERRVAVLIDIADSLRDQAFLALIPEAIARLKEEWKTEAVHLGKGTEILRSFNRIEWGALDSLSELILECRDALVEDAATGCASDDFRELVCALGTEGLAEEQILEALQDGFREYLRYQFRGELRACRSSSEFDALAGDIQEIAKELGMSVEEQIEELEHAQSEFEANEEARNERSRQIRKEEKRESDLSAARVCEMFGSLTLDRN